MIEIKLNYNKCINCEKRTPGCHSKCNHYKFINILNEKRKKERRKESDFLEFMISSRRKILKINTDNCKKYH